MLYLSGFELYSRWVPLPIHILWRILVPPLKDYIKNERMIHLKESSAVNFAFQCGQK